MTPLGKPCSKCDGDDWIVQHPPSAIKRGRKPHYRCRLCRSANVTKWKRRTRLECIAAYGGQCSCCGEAEEAFLCIDHINGDGAEHRRKIGLGAYLIYADLKRRGWPSGFQVLCANCNMAKERPGGCPHQTERTA